MMRSNEYADWAPTTFSVNSTERTVFHNPTCTVFRYGDDGALNLLWDVLLPPEYRESVIAGARDAVQRELKRDPRMVGQFWN